MPYTSFYCDDQPYPGFFADMDTRCQGILIHSSVQYFEVAIKLSFLKSSPMFVCGIIGWHYCDIDGRQASFLCPNGTQFSQAVFVCDWWFNVRCDLSPRLYAINARLYQQPKVDPTRPHRIITKQLVEDIFTWNQSAVATKWREKKKVTVAFRFWEMSKDSCIVYIMDSIDS